MPEHELAPASEHGVQRETGGRQVQGLVQVSEKDSLTAAFLERVVLVGAHRDACRLVDDRGARRARSDGAHHARLARRADTVLDPSY